MKTKKRKSIGSKLLRKYKLILTDAATFEEKKSFSLTLLNILFIAALILFLSTSIVITIFIYSPLGTNLTKKNSPLSKREVYDLNQKLTSLESTINNNDKFIHNIQNIISSKTEEIELDTAIRVVSQVDLNEKALIPSKFDVALREEVAGKKVFQEKQDKTVADLIAPNKGVVLSKYNLGKDRLGVIIKNSSGKDIKAIADGVVIYIGRNGSKSVVVIQHGNEVMSVYHYKGALMKEISDYVKKGDTLFKNNTKVPTTKKIAPQLYFQLWISRSLVDPEKYIVF